MLLIRNHRMCVYVVNVMKLHLFLWHYVIIAVQNVHSGVNTRQIIFGRFYTTISSNILLWSIIEFPELSYLTEKSMLYSHISRVDASSYYL